MIIIHRCMRCGKEIKTIRKVKDVEVVDYKADSSNSDYVIAGEFIADESRLIFRAVKHNKITRAKLDAITEYSSMTEQEKALAEKPEEILDHEYDRVVVDSVKQAEILGEDLIRVDATEEVIPVQKAGLVCPACFNPDTDTVIWGYHKADPLRVWP